MDELSVLNRRPDLLLITLIGLATTIYMEVGKPKLAKDGNTEIVRQEIERIESQESNCHHHQRAVYYADLFITMLDSSVHQPNEVQVL